jgi:hypothetical protein
VDVLLPFIARSSVGAAALSSPRQIRLVLANVVRKELANALDEEIPEEIRLQFVVDAFLAVLSWSLGRKPALPPPRMDAIFRRLVLCGLGAPCGPQETPGS